MKIRKGSTYRFNYPKEFRTLPDYSAHRESFVKVLRQCTTDECNQQREYERMFVVKAPDGWIGHAWESELEKVKA